MENRRKFYKGGSWDGYTPYDRFVITQWALDAHLNHKGKPYIDNDELNFIIKNAFVSKIYISQAVVDDIDKVLISNPNILGKIRPIYDKLISDNFLDYSYFDICKLGNVLNNKRKKFPKLPHIVVEHVVPGDVYLGKVKDFFIKGKYDSKVFDEIFNAVSICLVSKDQDASLNIYKSIMPLGYEDFIRYPFARYDDELGGVKIDVHGWTMKDGRLDNGDEISIQNAFTSKEEALGEPKNLRW